MASNVITENKDRQFDHFVITDGTAIITTTYSATSDNNIVKQTTFLFSEMWSFDVSFFIQAVDQTINLPLVWYTLMLL